MYKELYALSTECRVWSRAAGDTEPNEAMEGSAIVIASNMSSMVVLLFTGAVETVAEDVIVVSSCRGITNVLIMSGRMGYRASIKESIRSATGVCFRNQ